MRVNRIGVVIATAIFGLTATSCAHPSALDAPKSVTVDMQGKIPTCNDPLVSGFYDITVAAFANGPGNVNLPSYQEKSYAHFRANAASMGGDPDRLVDHLKDIPRQLIQIVTDDPKVLDSCRNLSLALTGPS